MDALMDGDRKPWRIRPADDSKAAGTPGVMYAAKTFSTQISTTAACQGWREHHSNMSYPSFQVYVRSGGRPRALQRLFPAPQVEGIAYNEPLRGVSCRIFSGRFVPCDEIHRCRRRYPPRVEAELRRRVEHSPIPPNASAGSRLSDLPEEIRREKPAINGFL